MNLRTNIRRTLTVTVLCMAAAILAPAQSSYAACSLLRPTAPGGSSGGDRSACIAARIESCKRDPTRTNKSFCTSAQGRHLFGVLCDMLNPSSGNNAGLAP